MGFVFYYYFKFLCHEHVRMRGFGSFEAMWPDDCISDHEVAMRAFVNAKRKVIYGNLYRWIFNLKLLCSYTHYPYTDLCIHISLLLKWRLINCFVLPSVEIIFVKTVTLSNRVNKLNLSKLNQNWTRICLKQTLQQTCELIFFDFVAKVCIF